MVFYHRLALRLGRSVRELLATVSSEELTMWMAFDRSEPIGDWRQDLGFGVIASTIANVNRTKNHPAFAPIDFMPLSPKPEKPKLGQQIRSFLKARQKAKEG